MVHINLINLHQYRFPTIQDFRDQYLAMKKMYNVLELHLSRCKSDARAMQKKKNVTNPTDAQLNKAMDRIKKEHHNIMFMYKADRQSYGKLLEQIESDGFFLKNC